ncbi:NADPH-dependent ferric siderophore reductase [Actinoplanes campanulatus]|uniref:NADPH-dependent ferric siderophore reductase n=1 Tax=Actinoplanes campanulatus TaxID=113559 RepID=A0A7W5AEL2_9ACTN|nr:siderophore-interacting protein [Actinoplanes campanulatus]MBB3094590.1 NADPH-dependent ferric siderophore reductase [Actinoplanes campanulatus]
MSSRSMRTRVTFPIVLRELTVLRVVDVNAGTRRITVGGPQLGAFHAHGLDLPAWTSEGFDDHVKFFFAAPGADRPVLPRQEIASLDWPAGERPIAKDYTPHGITADGVDFDFVRHGSGPAATWAEHAKPGDTVWMAGPKMSLSHPAGADVIVAAGDETALPALRRWLHEMPAGTRAHVFIEIADDSRRQELPTAADAEITWLSGGSPTLDEAVRALPWPDGVVFAWVAGEAGAIRPLRRYLRVERELPASQVEITGYWKRSSTEAPLDETIEEQPEDDAHDRLHELAEIVPGLAIRVAVTLGVIDAVDAGDGTAAAIAARVGADPGTVESLLRYLAALDVVAVDADGRHVLTALGEELAEDADDYHLENAEAILDLSVLKLAAAGAPESLRALFETDERLGGQARGVVEDLALWIAPLIMSAYDWAGTGAVAATGHGAGAAVNAIARAHPGVELSLSALPSALTMVRDRVLDKEHTGHVELVPTSGAVVVRDGATHLLVHFLDWLTDADAAHLLAEFARALPAGTDVVVVEDVRPDGDTDVEEIENDLRLRAAFGTGRRTAEQVTALLETAGLRTVMSTDIGWSHRMWHLTPA